MNSTDFTDFQKDCITKAKDQLHLIPRIDHVIRWKDMPGKVAVLVSLLKASKLSISEFSEELKISPKALSYFTKGKDHANKSWPELLILVNPEQFKTKKEKAEARSAEFTVTGKILTILNREAIKDRGLRDETIKTELRPIKSRFISSVLNKLLVKQKIERFIGESKKVMWKVPVGDAVASNSEQVIPQMISSNEPKTTVIEFPKQSEVKINTKEDNLKEAWKLVLANLNIADITCISEKFGVINIRVPLKSSNVDFPYSQWRKDLTEAVNYLPKFCPYLVNLWKSGILWEDDLYLLIAIRQTMVDKFKTEQSVVDHFNTLLELGNSKVS
jgi:hypothetical protein